ncbi:MAG: hypothetical protein F4W92_05655 [Gammaproteobacteria bacterium]|nr:hypothetical protein [Gammaproteobacteria bacterium]
MPEYCVNKNLDSQGKNHEVHRLDQHRRKDGTFGYCRWLPKKENQVELGWHLGCAQAVQKSKREHFANSDGCFHCSEECHEG